MNINGDYVCHSCSKIIDDEDLQTFDPCECEGTLDFCSWECFWSTHNTGFAAQIPGQGPDDLVVFDGGCGFALGDHLLVEAMVRILEDR